jgi:ribosomal protein S14
MQPTQAPRSTSEEQMDKRSHSLHVSTHNVYVTGRRRGVIGRFGLSRIEARERINKGEILGVRKSSW